MRPEHIEDVLIFLHSGPWFGWSDTENRVYANLVIHGDQEKPTQEWLEEELTNQQEAWDAEQVSRQAKRDSAKSKLEALGLTTEEVQEAFGL